METTPTVKQRRKIIAAMLERDGIPYCHYCGKPLAMYGSAKRTTNALGCVDHKVPLHEGGTNDLENLVLACRSCNSMRRWYSYEEVVALTKLKHPRDSSR
jgi:5-methylcytosine-specific restriction endonuclease McrA